MRKIVRFCLFAIGYFILCNHYIFANSVNDSTFFVHGYFESLTNGDTIELQLANERGLFDINDTQKYKAVINNHSFIFRLFNISFPRYVKLVSLKSLAGNSRYSFLIEGGDSINIQEKNYAWEFTGRNALKYSCQYKIFKYYDESNRIPFPNSIEEVKGYYEKMDSIGYDCLLYLKSQLHKLNRDYYTLLKSGIIVYFQGARKLSPFFWKYGRNGNDSIKINLSNYKNKIYDSNVIREIINDPIIRHSQNFSTLIIDQYIFDSCILKNKPYRFSNCYKFLKDNFREGAREELLYNLFCYYNNRRIQDSIQYCIKNAIENGYVEERKYVTQLYEISKQYNSKLDAYSFVLPNEKGALTKLADYSGKVVLLDFWYSNCGPCAEIHPYLEKIREYFKDKPFQLIAISTDKNKDVWIKSIREGKRTSSNNVNLYTEGKGINHPVIEKYHVNSYPTLILIDKNGKLINPVLDPRTDDCVNLIGLIKKAML